MALAATVVVVILQFGNATFTPNQSDTTRETTSSHMTDVLPPELSSGSTTYKLEMKDTSRSETPHFRYSGQSADGQSVTVNGWMSRLRSPEEAVVKLKESADGYTRTSVTLQPKGAGQRFSGYMWQSKEPVFGWTSGSLMFIIYPPSDQAAQEFERAAKF